MSSIQSDSQYSGVLDFFHLPHHALLEIIDQSPGICCVYNDRGEFEYANAAALAFFGCAFEEIKGKNLLDFVHPDDLEAATESFVKLLSIPDFDTQFCARFVNVQGSEGFLTWKLKTDFNSKLLYGTAQVETDADYQRNRSTAKHDLKADYFYLSEELSGLGFWRADLPTSTISWSERVFEIHDLPYSEKAPTWQDCLALYHPDDRDKVHQCLKRAVLDAEPFSIQFRLLTPQNRQKHVHARGYIESLPNGKPVAVVGTYQDVSKQISTGEELQHFSTIVKYSNLSVLMCDAERRISWVNPGFESLTGYSLDDVLGQHPSQLLHGPKTSAQTKAYIKEQLDKGETVDCDVLNYTKSGDSHWIRLTITPIRDDDGNIVKFLGFQTDISQKKRSEEVMRQASHLESLNVMVGGIAHDFNNVMGIAKSNVDLLSIEYEGANNQYVKKIEKAVDRAAQLTQKLLQFSNVSHSEKSANHIQACVQEASLLLDKSFAKYTDCFLSLVDEPIWCHLNKTDLEDCLINLAINARDAIEYQGNITISVALARPPGNCVVGYLPSTETQDDFCKISVTDTGKGIAKEDIEKVFTPFYTTKPNGSGTGLGLSMVYNFVKQSHGYVGMSSEEGVGTTVTLWLPTCDAPVCESQAGAKDTQSETPQSFNILLLDDEVDLLEVTATLLRREGHQVTCCHNAEMALAVLQESSFDLFLSDILMPGEKQPIDVITAIEQYYDSTKIMLMSGYQGTNNEALLAYPILQKPFSRDKLNTSIRALFK